MRAIVYWAHLPEHTDIKKHGYIGITKDSLSKRKANHFRYKGKCRFQSAIKKYGDKIVWDTLLIGSPDYVALMEVKLRPDTDIGWNMRSGGENNIIFSDKHRKNLSESLRKPETRKKMVDRMKGREVSEETRKKMSVIAKNRKYSDETKEKMSKSISEAMTKDVRNRISDKLKGRIKSEQERKNISEAAKKGWEKRRANYTQKEISDSARKAAYSANKKQAEVSGRDSERLCRKTTNKTENSLRDAENICQLTLTLAKKKEAYDA